MGKTNVLTLRIPLELKHKIAQVAEEQGVSINQLAMYALTKEVMVLESSGKLAGYWRDKSRKEIIEDFDAVLAKIQDRAVPKWDKADD